MHPRLPSVYVEPIAGEEGSDAGRVETPRAPAEWRKRNFAEVEVTLSPHEAHREALRCLRCVKACPENAIEVKGWRRPDR